MVCCLKGAELMLHDVNAKMTKPGLNIEHNYKTMFTRTFKQTKIQSQIYDIILHILTYMHFRICYQLSAQYNVG